MKSHILIETYALNYAIGRVLNQLNFDFYALPNNLNQSDFDQYHLIAYFFGKIIFTKTQYKTYDA